MDKLLSIEDEFRKQAAGRPISVKAIVISKDNKVLLLSRPNDSRLDIPGGGIEDGETLHEGLTRELQEEIGLEVDNALPLYTFLRKVEGKPEKLIQYVLCKMDNVSSDISPVLSEEHVGFGFCALDNVPFDRLAESYAKAIELAQGKIDTL